MVKTLHFHCREHEFNPWTGGSSRCSHKEKKGYIAGKRKVLGMVQKCCSSCSLNECYTEGRKSTLWDTEPGEAHLLETPRPFQNVPNTKCLVFLLKMQIPHAPAIHIRFPCRSTARTGNPYYKIPKYPRAKLLWSCAIFLQSSGVWPIHSFIKLLLSTVY